MAMTHDETLGPAALVRAAAIARRFYLDGRSKIEIAEEFQLSRFKVARILDDARTNGLVRIEIGFPTEVDTERSQRLADTFGLHHAIVVATHDDEHEQSLRRHLAKTTADLLTEIVTEADVLGLAWGRSLVEMGRSLTRLPPCTVVQLTGVLARPDMDENSIDLVRAVAKASGGPAFPFYAPFIVDDAAGAEVLRRQPAVMAAVRRFSSVTKAVVAIGSWDPPQSTLWDAVSRSERRTLLRLGVRAELSGVFIDIRGDPVPTSVSERMIGVTGDELRQIPEVIAVAYGVMKVPAVLAALRGGLVTSLVTHTSLAQRLLDGDG